jgi:hypothetical protein
MFMKRGPIGVWFSVALVIFGLSVWGGFHAGSGLARYRYRRNQQELQKSYSPERLRLESESIELRSLEYMQVLVKTTQHNRKVEKEYVLAAIPAVEKHAQESTDGRIRPVIEFNLGLLYLEAAIAEQADGNKDLAEKDMKSAKAIFQSLGWKDYSEETLRAFAQSQLNQWKTVERNSGK